MPDLLWEIGTEEIPAGYLQAARESLAAAFAQGCAAANIAPAAVRSDGTPRRIVLFAEGLPATQPARAVEAKGPPQRAAFDADGNPTRAAQAFAEKNGVTLADLEVRETEKGPYVFTVRNEGGGPVADLLPAICAETLASVHTPKSMFWGVAGLRFCRPIRSICLLLDDRVVECELAGLAAGRAVHGHPFLSPGPLDIPRADWNAYRDALRDAHVVLETAGRRELVRTQVEQELGGPCRDAALIDEVANLVEWPTALTAHFDAEFLEVPAAVLEAAMTEHQRYFPVRAADGALENRFVVVANRTAAHAGTIRAGNERVLRARLADARFFYELDRKRPLADRVAELAEVGAQKELGTLADRAERLRGIAQRIAAHANAPAAFRGLDADSIARAARLAKADLRTEVVGEFPSLQGVIGEIYARADGEPDAVAAAIREHYLPRGLSDQLPGTPLGLLLAMADKALTIMEAYALGREPTGSKDQFGVRRATYGLLRCMTEGEPPLGGKIAGWLWLAAESLPGTLRTVAHERLAAAREFAGERVRLTALDEGRPHDIVRACAAAGSGTDDPVDFLRRCKQLEVAAGRGWWGALVEVVDRTRRILGGTDPGVDVNAALFTEDAERHVAECLARAELAVQPLVQRHDYLGAAEEYATHLAAPVHQFFEDVFVNADDLNLRRNRHALLRDVNALFTRQIADLSLIETAGAVAEGAA